LYWDIAWGCVTRTPVSFVRRSHGSGIAKSRAILLQHGIRLLRKVNYFWALSRPAPVLETSRQHYVFSNRHTCYDYVYRIVSFMTVDIAIGIASARYGANIVILQFRFTVISGHVNTPNLKLGGAAKTFSFSSSFSGNANFFLQLPQLNW
jgi:hypothetical protein